MPEDMLWLQPVLIGAVIVFILDLIGNMISFSNRFMNALATAIVFAVVFGGLPGVPRLSAATVPTATPTAAMAPSLINKERLRFCLAGAMAEPAGFDAPLPAVLTPSAAAVPSGSGDGCCLAAGSCCAGSVCGCGEFGAFVCSSGVAVGAAGDALGAGASGPADGSTVVPRFG